MKTKVAGDEISDRVVTRRVAARWSEGLVRKGWVPIYHSFLDLYAQLPIPLSPTEAMVVVMLMRFKWDDRNPFPSLKRVGSMMGLGSTSIRNHVRSLEKKGYLKRVYRNGYSNSFDLTSLFHGIEAKISQDKVTTRQEGMVDPLDSESKLYEIIDADLH